MITRMDGEQTSLVCIMACTDGIIIASDTRRTVRTGDDVQYYDNEKKIFPIAGTDIVAAATGTNRFGTENTPIGQIITECADADPEQMANNIVARLGSPQYKGDVYVALSYYARGIPFVTLIAGEAGSKLSPVHYQRALSDIFATGRTWATKIIEEMPNNAVNVELGLERLFELYDVVFAVNDILDADKRFIGGHMDTYILKP